MQDTAPIAWGLFNPNTGKISPKCYMREDSAKAAAARETNRWRTIVAVPLYLHPSASDPARPQQETNS